MAPESSFDCRCGESIEARPPVAVEVPTRRCSACGAITIRDDEYCGYCGSEIVRLVERGSLICPDCYARNLDDARYCLGCGDAFDPQSPPSVLSELQCPCCECWMSTRDVGGLEIHECPECLGLWAPENRFDELIDRAAASARAHGLAGESSSPRVDGGNPLDNAVEYRRCPVCDALMNRRNFKKRSGVIVDRCHRHGTWLDANELERIAGFVLSGRAERVTAIEQEKEAARQKSEARAAVKRIGSPYGESRSDHSIFGLRRKTVAAETIFDLLTGILN